MANEEDSSVSEEFDETLDLQELHNHVKDIITRIQRKKETLEEFVSSMKKENKINKTVLKRFQNIEYEFKEGRKSKAEFKELQQRVDDRIKDVEGKLESIENALQYISLKEVQISAVKDEISKSPDDESHREELSKFNNEVQSLFSELKIKFRECKKVKLSLLTKFNPEDLIQSVKSWEKAAEVAREISRKVNDLQKELQNKAAAVIKIEEELKQEKENAKEQEQELLRLAEDMKIDDESKREQAVLINTFRSLLDESEKLVRNLEAQNSNLNQIILDERNRVSDLRGKLCDLQEQIQYERKSNKEMDLKFEHMKVEFHTAKNENAGYKRDLEIIRKELDAIKEIKDQVSKKVTKPDDETLSGDSLEDLEENLEIKDKLLNEKYFEVEQLRSELEMSLKRVIQLENDISSITEDKKGAIDKLQVKEREVEELTDILSDTQTALESEKLAKDQFVIKCDMLERKNALIELQLQEYDEKDGKNNEEDIEEEMRNLREMLQEEKLKVAESTSMIEELEEQLKASEESREYEEDIKTRSIENIVHAELENRKLMEIVEELREKLSEKDSGIEELIAHCAVEELKLREEAIALTNQLQIYKRDCVYKANIIERLRRQVSSRGSGLDVVDEEDDETETTALVKAATLERQLQEERLKIMKYEEVLLTLNKQYEEADGVIREKDHELSKKSAEDGKRIAELLQELESDKMAVTELEEQIENLEEILSLKEVIDKMETAGDDTENIHEELKDIKDDYAAKKLRRKDNLISELKEEVETLKNQVDIEQKRLQKQEDLIEELNDARDKVNVLEDENFCQKEYIEELSDRVAEGQKLISELEGVADRERMRVATIEQLLLQEKQTYSKHLDGVKELKKKVHKYQNHVGNLRSKVDRINRNLPEMFSPRDDSKTERTKENISPLQEKDPVKESNIKEVATTVSAVEEKNEKLNNKEEERGNSKEEDEKIDQLLTKSKECEDLVEYMKDELELVRKRYQGLSGESSENDNLPTRDRKMISEEVQETTDDELHANPMLLFPLIDDEKENEGDDEQEEGESGETIYFDDESEKRDVQAQEQQNSQKKQRELLHHLLIFEKVFEQIFAEEGKRIDVVLEKFRSVIQKNTELVAILQHLRQTLSETKIENETKKSEIKQMKNEIEHLEQKGKEKENDYQYVIEEMNREIEGHRIRVNQLQENMSVEQLLKSEYEREIENLKNKILEEREAAEQLREDVERETNARYDFEVKLREIEDEAYNSASIINELQKDLETERKCYGVVTERLQEEQQRLKELESYVKETEKLANDDKELVGELRKSLSSEEKQRMEFLNKLERLENESIEKDEAINELLNQLGNERNKMEELFAEIDLEKMTKAKAEAKLRELEENFNRDELIFEELRRNVDLESARNREISEILDKEQERNFDLEEKTKELEKQVLMDLELFDELKTTIEQEREHNRELDALLNEKSSAYNNRDKLLAELDDQLAEIRAALKKEELRNEELEQKLKNTAENETVVKDLQDMLNSQIIHAGELNQKAQELTETNKEQNQKIQTLETALAKLKEISAQVSKELEEDLEAWGEFADVDTDDKMDADEVMADLNGNVDYSTDRNALRMKALLNNELKIKKKLIIKTDEYKKQLHENCQTISQLNDAMESYRHNIRAIEEALHAERKQREDNETKLNKAESDLLEERKQREDNETKLNRAESDLLEERIQREDNGTKLNKAESDLLEERKQREDNETKLNKAESDLLEERKQREDNETKLNKAESDLLEERKQREDNETKLNKAESDLLEERKQREDNETKLNKAESDLLEERKQREDNETKLNKAESDLSEERKNADISKMELEKLNQRYKETGVEIKKLTKSIEEKAKEDDNKMITIQKLQKEKENALKEKKEKEDECELMKTYYEEENKFAKERLEQIQSLKKQIEELEQVLNKKEIILNELREENDHLSSKVEETSNNFKTQASVLKEHKEKLKNMDAKEKYIKDLQKEIEELFHLHRRNNGATEKTETETPNNGIMTHLKEIKDEFDGLETELSQKDEQIKKLNEECLKARSENEETEKHASKLQDQIDSHKKLLKQHEAHAQKSANAMEKARLLCELLQADIEIKDLTISQLNSDVYSLKFQMNDKDIVGRNVPPVYRARKYEEKQADKGFRSDVQVALPTTSQKHNILKGKDEETKKLREQIIHMAEVMEKSKEHNQRVLAERDMEIDKQKKTIAMIKILYHSLKTESKREEIFGDVQLLIPEKETNDAVVIMNDLEKQLKSMKDELQNKVEVVKSLKENITEIKRDNEEIDRNLLSRKENVHKLLSIQLEEKEKKLKRMENLLEGLKEIYHGKVEKESLETSEVKDSSVLHVDPAPDRGDAEAKPQNDNELQLPRETSSCEETDETIHGVKSEKELQTEKEMVAEDNDIFECHQDLFEMDDKTDGNRNPDKDLNPVSTSQDIEDQNKDNDNEETDQNLLDTLGEQALIETCMPLDIQLSKAKRLAPENVNDKDFPTSGWKAKLLAYVVIGIGLSFLPQYLKDNTLRLVLAGVATPLFYLLSAIEVKVYRKKAENYLRTLQVNGESILETTLEDDYLLGEERKLKAESDKKVIEGLKEQLEQEIKAKAAKKEDMKVNDESKVLQEQKIKVCYLEKTLHDLEMAKIEEQEQNKSNFDEYIKLRNAVEELQRKRDAESKSRLELEDIKKHNPAKLERDLKVFSLPSRSLPLWIALAMGIYQLTTLHPVAPCSIIILFTLYAANSWFNSKNFKNKLLEEREAAEYKSAELEDLTELLEKEHEVVETQKAAIDIMVREIDNEYVSRKGKTVTLAKMILQMKELEEMRCALKDENVGQAKDNEMDAAMKNISRRNASERVRLYFEVSRKFPQLEEDSLDDIGELGKTVKELATFAEAQVSENQSKTIPITKQGNARKNGYGKKLITAVGVTLSTIAMVTSIIFKSYVPAILMAAQLFIYLLSQRQRKYDGQNKASPEELQTKLDQEVKRNKANRLQIGKLKRLLATEKSLKKSDEVAKEIRLRVKERAQKKKMAI